MLAVGGLFDLSTMSWYYRWIFANAGFSSNDEEQHPFECELRF